MPTEIIPMTIETTIFWVTSGGFLGGLFDYFNRFNINIENNKIYFQGAPLKSFQVFSLGCMNTALGIGGAYAVQFVMISIGKFQSVETVETIFLLFTISVVSGFSGRRFLSLVSSKLEDQIGEANRKSGEAKEEAQESLLISSAIATLNPSSTITERNENAEKLMEILATKPKDRMLAILCGRLFRRNNEFESAIEILTSFLNAKLKDKEFDDDYADGLYNRACYLLLSSDENVVIINSALKDLSESIKYSPDNAIDARGDSDFDLVRNNPKFLEIVK